MVSLFGRIYKWDSFHHISYLRLSQTTFFVYFISLQKHAYSNTLNILPLKLKISDKTFWCSSYICSIHRLWVLVRTASTRRFLRVPQSMFLSRASRRGGSNEYTQSMFLSRNKKNNVYPYEIPVLLYKNGVKGGQNYIGMFS